MQWEVITALVALTGLLVTGAAAYVRLSLRAALAEFREELIGELDRLYARRDEVARLAALINGEIRHRERGAT